MMLVWSDDVTVTSEWSNDIIVMSEKNENENNESSHPIQCPKFLLMN